MFKRKNVCPCRKPNKIFSEYDLLYDIVSSFTFSNTTWL